ncbi:single-stranded-DNA-specific exonuclease RecJ [Bacillus sp. RG28]|uniref:Single-stranded-DNA-specific exonuclease RecJ n=1 Tax=Gottfriedia endophytica TaxID=2820819 RepID=A0A940SJ40_9BACI|nr:single-stranded-DNA-specific exonuclease RecJ [Gottfriedia endophytica]MBP0723828.1 single-stranded-DNA-specific exonuclease RecJ [Gottfriedia endophytica]
MLKAKARWKQKEENLEVEELFSNKLNISPLLAKLLVNRGITKIDEAEKFLYEENMSFHDPFLLEGMDIAVERVRKAIDQKEKILIFGDYDADGVSSTTVLLLTLKKLEADVDFYIPNRFTEGYGPNKKAFQWASDQGYKLIITVDTGIAAVSEVNFANELGMDVIITDHHEAQEVLPNTIATIHPKLSPNYPFKELAGVGVVFKFATALLNRIPEEFFEIVSIGTVADLVPLVDENRLIVKKGVRQLRQTKFVGLQALLEISGITSDSITEETIGFALGPRINAVGRLGDAKPAVDLLLEQDKNQAKLQAQQIDGLNRERQELVNMMTEEAIEQVNQLDDSCSNKVFVLAKEGWNAGVVGIVASRLVDRYYKPVIVLSIDHEKGIAKGSARSIEGFSLFDNLSKCKEILPHFGGHTLAAGMTLAIDDVEELRQRLNQYADELLTEEDFTPLKEVDIKCTVEDVTISLINEINLLAPFGMHNPKPFIEIKDVNIAGLRQIGSDGNHLKCQLKDNEAMLDVVGFSFGQVVSEISPTAKVSVLGMLSINEWNGLRKPQMMLQDIKVDDWQLFDYRGQDVSKINFSVEEDQLIFVSHNEYKTEQLSRKYPLAHFISYDQVQNGIDLSNAYLVLLSLPNNEDEMKSLFQDSFPKRIYLIFEQEDSHLFTPIPSRENFKKYYGILANTNPFDIKKYEEALCKKMVWKKSQLDFMTQVFFDLEFVTIEDGKIRLLPQSDKKDLTQSRTYEQKLLNIELERIFLYSTCDELKSFFLKLQISHI